MYIFELIAELFKKKETPEENYIPPIDDLNYTSENPQNCKHFFMPIDSTNTMFACKNCGLVISKENLLKYQNKMH